jgi:hypothetical protein
MSSPAVDSEPERALRRAVVWIAAFAWAFGWFITTKKFLDMPPTDPVAVGRVTVEGASKLQDYVRAGWFYVSVVLLTLGFGAAMTRLLERWCRRAPRGPQLSVVVLAATPFFLSPFLYMATRKELWSILLPPVLAAIVVVAEHAFRSKAWFRDLFSPENGPFHLLVAAAGGSSLLFRYAATGERIAHIPSLLLEVILLLFFLGLFHLFVILISRMMAVLRGDDTSRRFRQTAIGVVPLLALAPAAVLPLPAGPVVLAFLALSIFAIVVMHLVDIPPPAEHRVRLWVIFAAVPLLLFALNYASSYQHSQWVDLFHKGESLGPASDYLKGQRPYHDILPLHGLLENGLLDAWLMQFFGRSAEVAITRSIILSALMIPALWIFSWVAFRSVAASILSVFGAFVMSADNQRGVLEILVLLVVVASIRSGRSSPLFAAGLLSALALFFSLDIGLYCLAGTIITLVAIPILVRERMDWRWSGVSSAWFVAGVALGSLPFLLYLGRDGAAGAFLVSSFVTIPSVIDAIWSTPFPSLDRWFAHQPTSRSIFELAWHFRYLLNPLVIVLALIVILRRAIRRSLALDDRILLALAVFALVTQRSALGRADFQHQWFSAFLISPLAVALLWSGWRVLRSSPPRARAVSHGLLLVVLPGLLLALWVPGLLNQRLEHTLSYRLRLEATEDPAGEASRRRIAAVTEAIRSRTGPDTPIFDFSNQPALYFYADRPNPTRFYQTPLMSPLPFQREAIRDLEASPPAVVIMTSPDRFDRFDAVTNRDRAPMVASWIEHHYELYRQVEGIELWTPAAVAETWREPREIRSPRDVRLRPAPDARLAFPSFGSIVGADGARWSSDVIIRNPHHREIELRLRFVSLDRATERRIVLAPLHGARFDDAAETLFGAPDRLGVLWVLHDHDLPPLVRISTRRGGGSGRAIHSPPIGEADVAAAATGRSTLLLTGFVPSEGERVNLALVNMGWGMAVVEIDLRDGANHRRGVVYQTRVAEGEAFLVSNLLRQLDTTMPSDGIVRIRVIEGAVGAQMSIFDPAGGSAEILTAVPSVAQ